MEQKQLVLLHGWLNRSTCWSRLLPYLSHYQIHYLNLPGHGSVSNEQSFATPKKLLQSLAAQIPQQASLLAWSLGGTLAQLIAGAYPDRLASLVCLCSSLKFVASDDWSHGMDTDTFSQFVRDFEEDPKAYVKKFIAIQSMGDSNSSELREYLRMCALDIEEQGVDCKELRMGLDLLGHSDARHTIQGFNKPISFIAGEKDQLVSASSVKMSSELVPNGKFYCLPDSGHAPMLSQPQALAELLDTLLL